MIRLVPSAFRTLFGLTALSALAGAQLEHGGAPPSTFLRVNGAVPTVTLEPVDVAALLAEDALQGGKGPFRFGADVPVDLGFEAGSWVALPGGDRLWRMRVESSGAYSLSFVFSEYDVPAGAELYLYNDDHSWTFGQFNVLNNNANGQMAIRPLAGDAVTLEYFVPAYLEQPGKLRIGTVVHDYKDVNKLFDGGSGAEGACEIDVACPQGVGWENQVRATTRLIIGGILCTGSLINNTANDGTQLYISANHCGSLGNAIFQFKYQRSGCGGGTTPSGYTVQGSTQLASSTTFDYRLVKITSPIPATYDPYYAGWDRTGTPPSSTATIHHPGGDPKKISKDNHPPSKSGLQWRILQWDLGVTEGGSSGCPLYTPEGRFVGQLCCGAAFCGSPYDDYFGRLDAEWGQIAAFLDPLGTGQTTLDGFDPSGGPPPGPTITGILPAAVDALIPGTAQTVSIQGTGFTPTTLIEVDGTLVSGIPSPTTFVSATLMTMDMPQVAMLGPATVKVIQAGLSDTATINVVAPALPKLQVGNGDEPVTAFSFGGMDVAMSSQVGDLFLMFWSPSGVPSVLPGIVAFEMGNNFAAIWEGGTHAIPAEAWKTIHVPLGGVPPLTTLFLEGVVIRAGGLALPVDTSNRQECLVLF
jgi:hypothetical protein